jgi:hypothetical protein
VSAAAAAAAESAAACAAAASTAAIESAAAAAAIESAAAASSVDLLPQEDVAIKPAIAKIANTFFICYGFLNYNTNVLVLILIVQVVDNIFFICFCKRF